MSILKNPILFTGSLVDKHIYTLFDSGANLSVIHENMLGDLENPIKLGKPKRMATAAENTYVEVTHRITLDFVINEVELSDEFLVIPNLSEDAIIGAATMQKWRIKLDFEHDQIIVDPKVAKLQLI